MAEGFRATGTTPMANKILNCVFRNTLLTGPAALWLMLHTGPPGPAGTANVANANARKQVLGGTGAGFAVAATGQITNAGDIAFLSVASTQVYSHASIWDNATHPNGDFIISGSLVGSATINNDFTITTGQLVISLANAT